jgi:ferredoxin
MAGQVVNSLEFFRHETCGKCVPCRIGTDKLLALGNELLTGVVKSAAVATQERLVEQLAEAMDQTSICGLGMVAASPLTSYLKYFQQASPAAGGTPGATGTVAARSQRVDDATEQQDPAPIDEEPLFARGFNNQLIRLDDPSLEQYELLVSLVIDGRRVSIAEAVPSTDALGDVLYQPNGDTIPRATTILDAATKLYGPPPSNPIPTLCHQPHLTPVGVCRICMVLIGKEADLRLMPSLNEVSGIPAEGTNLIIVAAVNNALHFRVFDAEGKVGMDADENGLTEKAERIEALRKQLDGLWPPHTLTREEAGPVIATVMSIVGQTSGRRKRSEGGLNIRWQRKLLPACQHRVEDGMVVLTLDWDGQKELDIQKWLRDTLGSTASDQQFQEHLAWYRGRAETIGRSVTTVVELLMADHLREDRPFDKSDFNELRSLGKRLHASGKVFPTRREVAQPSRARQEKSRSFMLKIDHDACILCDRCIRGCADIQKSHVIGRNGKGGETLIGFDLNVPMSASSCVECGECLISCPTSAIMALRQIPIEPKRRKWLARLVHDISSVVPSPLRSIRKEFLKWKARRSSRRRS